MEEIRAEALEVVGTGDHLQIIRFFKSVSDAYDSFSEMKKGLNAVYDSFSQEKVPDALRAKEVKFLMIEGIGRVGMSNRWSCSILDKDRGFQWLREQNAGDMIKPSVHAQTLASFAKDRLETYGKEMPDDIFKVSINTYTSITKK